MDPKYPTPLPVNPFQDDEHRTAYQHCLALETETLSDKSDSTIPTVVCARLLGHLLHQLHITPGLGGVEFLAQRINDAASSGKGDDAVRALALENIGCLVQTFKRSSGPTPPAPESNPDSEHRVKLPLDVDSAAVSWQQLMQEGKLDRCTAKHYALRRDNYRCVITHSVDLTSVFDGLVVPEPGESGGLMEAAHIVPDLSECNTNDDIRPGTTKQHHTGDVWDVLSRFAEDAQLRHSLKGNNIHRLDNIMTLDTSVKGCFDRLWLWLKPAHPPVAHHYRTFAISPAVPGANRTVAFTHNNASPAPNTTYLALHALACEVAHMSGAAAYLNRICRDVEDVHLLRVAPDGSESSA